METNQDLLALTRQTNLAQDLGQLAADRLLLIDFWKQRTEHEVGEVQRLRQVVDDIHTECHRLEVILRTLVAPRFPGDRPGIGTNSMGSYCVYCYRQIASWNEPVVHEEECPIVRGYHELPRT